MMNNNYSNFWNDIQVNNNVDVDDKPKVDHIALAGYRRAIANFVNIVTNRSDIKVRYQQNGDSYTDGKTVTIGSKIDDIHVTLDSHRTVDVAHPIFWVNSEGKRPDPFTLISVDDVENGVWATTNPSWENKALEYVKSLASHARYPLCIWPPHCRIGTWGHGIVKSVSDALVKWEEDRFGVIDFVTKGSNIFTEHYSAVQADVPDPADSTTMLNTDLMSL